MVLLLLSACTSGRDSITALSQEQSTYFDKLEEELKKQRATFGTGIELQLIADAGSRRELLEWQRRQQKADILLQVDDNTEGNRELLLLKLAELDIGLLEQQRATERIDSARLDAILALYDALINAAAALKKNNDAILQYLESDDLTFAAKSLDVGGVVAAQSALQDVAAALDLVDRRSAEARAKQDEELQKNLDKAREAVIKGLSDLKG